MGFIESALGWIGRARSRVRKLIDRIRDRVEDSEQIAELARLALIRIGDKAAAWDSASAIRYLTPIATAIAAAQQNARITGTVGAERLEAVRTATLATILALRAADESVDEAWARVRPFIEAFRIEGKLKGWFGFEPYPDPGEFVRDIGKLPIKLTAGD